VSGVVTGGSVGSGGPAAAGTATDSMTSAAALAVRIREGFIERRA
jgi:hypothetical protein